MDPIQITWKSLFPKNAILSGFTDARAKKNRRTFVKRNPLQQGERKKMSIAKGKKIC